MPDLFDLSSEIILSIASHLRQVDLLNVSLTCQFLRQTTEPELFREFSGGGILPLIALILRILRKPDIARYVKAVDLRRKREPDLIVDSGHNGKEKRREIKLRTGMPVLSTEEVQILLRAFQASSRHGDMRLYQDSENYSLPTEGNQPFYRSVSLNCHIGLLLEMLPNMLTHLILGFYDLVDELYQGIEGLGPVLTSTKLRVLAIRGFASDRYKLPQFTWLRLFNIEQHPRLFLEPKSLSLRKLEIVDSHLEGRDVKTLLDACPLLTSFCYITRTSAVVDSSVDGQERIQLNSRHLVQFLEPVQATLEKLTIRMTDPSSGRDDYTKETGPRIQFSALKILDIGSDTWSGLNWLVEEGQLSVDRPTPQLQALSIDNTSFMDWDNWRVLSDRLARLLCRPHLRQLAHLKDVNPISFPRDWPGRDVIERHFPCIQLNDIRSRPRSLFDTLTEPDNVLVTNWVDVKYALSERAL
ncbi:hypothetical protein T440DRAFT_475114 [Plenodomus tracheiphilus IPT5]|uniref:F-box domain-containing protein n=1 Tax=Plenodomus tracheiphilus IPT5 TaxID=1408161 RepID=A0A6A7BJX0_9PLEO|nr:hypothetical protein T440DRAFT_475114 [Plenodomus tracheiphilus IPT5]